MFWGEIGVNGVKLVSKKPEIGVKELSTIY